MASKDTPKNEVTAATNNAVAAVPDYLKGMTGSGLQGLDSSDFTIPRVKLLQGISPEVEAFEEAKSGQFWHNVLDLNMGETFDFIVCSNKKRYMLLAPLNDSRGVLARADDGIHWTPPDAEFEVKLKGMRNSVKWKTAATVRESGLAEYGSSNPDDPDSNPAAVLFYDFMLYLPQRPDLSPVLMSLARSQVKKAKSLQTKIELRNIPMQAQVFRARVVKETGAEGEYNNWEFAANGFAAEEDFKRATALAARFTEYRGAGDDDDVSRPSSGAAATSSEY